MTLLGQNRWVGWPWQHLAAHRPLLGYQLSTPMLNALCGVLLQHNKSRSSLWESLFIAFINEWTRSHQHWRTKMCATSAMWRVRVAACGGATASALPACTLGVSHLLAAAVMCSGRKYPHAHYVLHAAGDGSVVGGVLAADPVHSSHCELCGWVGVATDKASFAAFPLRCCCCCCCFIPLVISSQHHVRLHVHSH